MTDLIPTDQDRALIDQSRDLEKQIVDGVEWMRQAWWKLGGLLYEFHEARGWEHLLGKGSSFEEWIAGPEIELGRTQVFRLMRNYRTWVVEHGVPPVELEGVDLSKADVAISAVRDGSKSVDEALGLCRELTREDLIAECYGAQGFDAELEPALCVCKDCGKAHRPKAKA